MSDYKITNAYVYFIERRRICWHPHLRIKSILLFSFQQLTSHKWYTRFGCQYSPRQQQGNVGGQNN